MDVTAAPAAVPVTLGSAPEGRLTYREAVQTPCLACPTSPCCTYLLLRRFELETLGDVDYVVYLANFEGIYVGIGRDGVARAYLYQPCGYLDGPSGLCTVHGTPTQPSICSHYNAHSCQYRHAMTADVHEAGPLMDQRRARWYVEHITFEDDRRVAALPDWDELLEAFRGMPLERRPAPPPPPDPVAAEWRSIALTSKDQRDPTSDYDPHRYSEPVIHDPCHGCEAWCCQTLIFGRDLPEDSSQVDFFRYCVGFPGVELGVAEDSWAVVVHTTCRHLHGGMCSVYGTDERPLRCGYYDPLKCSYRDHFGNPVPKDLVRVNREQFPVLLHSVVFDSAGRVRRLPASDLLRHRLGEAVRAGAI